MKLSTSTAALVMSIGAMSYVSAQAGSTSSPTPQATPGNSQNTVTFTGCVAPGSSSGNSGQFVLNNASASTPRATGGAQPGATTGTPGGTASSTPGGATTTTPGGATSTPSTSSPHTGAATGSAEGASSSSRSASPQANLILEGREAEIKQHVGHRVEVTGTLARAERPAESGSSSTSGSSTRGGSTAGTTGTAATGSTAAGATAPQRLQVSSVRMISNTCS